MVDIKRQRLSRQRAFCNEWTAFLRHCKANNVKMNQTIGAEKLGIKRSTSAMPLTTALPMQYYFASISLQGFTQAE